MGCTVCSHVEMDKSTISKKKNVDYHKYKIIWIDTTVNSMENVTRQTQLKSLTEQIYVFENISPAEQKLKEIKRGKIFIVLNIDLDQSKDFLFRIHLIDKIAAIYLFTAHVEAIRQYSNPIPKVQCVSNKYNRILKRLEDDLIVYDRLESIQILSNSTDKQLEFLENFAKEDLNNEMKKQLIKIYDDSIENKNLLKQFENELQPSTSIYWFTEQHFVHRLFDKMCQSQSINHLVDFQYLTRCLSIQLKDSHLQFLKEFPRLATLFVYRGQLMSIVDFKRLKMQMGKYIFIKNILLMNYDKDRALRDLNQCQPSTNEICFLLKISLNKNYRKTQIYSPIEINNQQYLLIMLAGKFFVSDIILNSHDQYPVVSLELRDY